MNFITSIAQGQTASQNIATGQNFLFWSLHRWERYGDSKGDYLQRVPYPRRALLEEGMINVACVFKVLQSCGAGNGLPESLTSKDHSSGAMSSCHKAFAVVRTSSQRSKQHLKVRDAQTGLHNCNTCRNKTLTNCNKFIHIVTRRHNRTFQRLPYYWGCYLLHAVRSSQRRCCTMQGGSDCWPVPPMRSVLLTSDCCLFNTR